MREKKAPSTISLNRLQGCVMRSTLSGTATNDRSMGNVHYYDVRFLTERQKKEQRAFSSKRIREMTGRSHFIFLFLSITRLMCKMEQMCETNVNAKELIYPAWKKFETRKKLGRKKRETIHPTAAIIKMKSDANQQRKSRYPEGPRMLLTSKQSFWRCQIQFHSFPGGTMTRALASKPIYYSTQNITDPKEMSALSKNPTLRRFAEFQG